MTHPSIYILIEFIKTIENSASIQLHRVQNAPMAYNTQVVSIKRRKCDIKKDEIIELIKEEYKQGLSQFKEFYSQICIHLSSLNYVFDESKSESESDSEIDPIRVLLVK